MQLRLSLCACLQESISVNQPGFNGVAPLHVAVSVRDLSMVAVLVAAGADVAAECDEPLEIDSDDDHDNVQYLTPLDMASANQQVLGIGRIILIDYNQ